jgi:hypothetical protein
VAAPRKTARAAVVDEAMITASVPMTCLVLVASFQPPVMSVWREPNAMAEVGESL